MVPCGAEPQVYIVNGRRLQALRLWDFARLASTEPWRIQFVGTVPCIDIGAVRVE